MKKACMVSAIIFAVMIVLSGSHDLRGEEKNAGWRAETSSKGEPENAVLTKVRLEDLLDVLTGEESGKEEQERRPGKEERSGQPAGEDDVQIKVYEDESPPPEKRKETPEEKAKREKRERRRKLIEGGFSILSSTQEIDYRSEKTIGESLALEGFHRYGLPLEDPGLQKYVNLVGKAIAKNSLRPGIPYWFVVIDSPLQNAFSCPGGIIFLSSALMKTIRTEAQLACILGHEVAHVGKKHALQSIRKARFWSGVGKITSAAVKGEKGREYEAMIGDLSNTLFERGLSQEMEYEADLIGMETAYRTGYGPNGMVEVLKALQSIESGSQKRGSWFSTHPPLSKRISRCEASLRTKYRDWLDLAQLSGRYSPYRKRIP